jgi:hypothetical protein
MKIQILGVVFKNNFVRRLRLISSLFLRYTSLDKIESKPSFHNENEKRLSELSLRGTLAMCCNSTSFGDKGLGMLSE